MAEPSFCVYILKCADNSYYIGNTSDLESRLDQHHRGTCNSYTVTRLPVQLVYQQVFSTRVEAFTVERKLKGWSRAKKEALINGQFDQLITLSKKKFNR